MRLNSAARLDSGLRGWIYNYARQNYWRVAAWQELEDLVQEGLLCYAICRSKYPHVTDRRQFMSLVQSTFRNRITDLANKHREQPETNLSAVVDGSDEQTFLERMLGSEMEIGSLLMSAQQAPPAVRAVLELLTTPQGKEKLKRSYRRMNGVTESHNQWLCWLIGLSPSEIDIQAALQSYFAS